MLRYISARLVLLTPTLLGVILLTFAFAHLVPGDPIEVILGEQAMPADRQALREALGLHLPILEQLKNYLFGIIRFDLGNSLFSGKAVSTLITNRLKATALLAAAAMFVALVIALPTGVWAAKHRNLWQDKTALMGSLIAFSMPSFWLGPVLIIIFSLWLGWLPVSGFEQASSIILPAITLGASMAAITTRLVRSSMLEVMSADYIRTARAKGLPENVILRKHGLRNALLPVVTIVFLQAGALLTGAILTEAVFSWPGIGGLIMDALNQRDYPVVQGCVLFIAVVYTFMMLLADICYGLIDPRIRYGKRL